MFNNKSYLEKQAANIQKLMETAKRMGFQTSAGTDWRQAAKLGMRFEKVPPHMRDTAVNKFKSFHDVINIDKNTFDNFLNNANKFKKSEHMVLEKTPFTKDIINRGVKYTGQVMPELPHPKPSIFNKPSKTIKDFLTVDNSFSLQPKTKSLTKIPKKKNFKEMPGINISTLHSHPTTIFSGKYLPESLKKKVNNYLYNKQTQPTTALGKQLNDKLIPFRESTPVTQMPSSADLDLFSRYPNKYHSVYDTNYNSMLSVKPSFNKNKTRVLKTDLSNYKPEPISNIQVEPDQIAKYIVDNPKFPKLLKKVFYDY